jgi:2'-5' RNA ligase
MYYILVHYPKIDTTKIENFRKKYDFTYEVIRAHITIVFPFQKKESEEILEHIKTVLSKWKPFEVTLEGFTKSHDHWLFLTLTKGNEKIIELYKDFYDGTLLGSGRLDIFIPHISLGGFAKKKDKSDFENYSEMHGYNDFYFDEENYKIALEEVRELNLVYPIKIEEMTLVELNETFTISKDIEVIKL